MKTILSLILIWAATAATGVRAEPFVPEDDARVLERLPAPGNAARHEMRRLRQELERNPRDWRPAVRLATAYLRLGRAESDPRYDGYAQAVLTPWLQHPEPPAPVLLLRARIRQNRHDFDGSLNDLSRVLAADRRNAQAWFSAAMILRVRGELDAAARHCAQLRDLTDELAAVGCASAVKSLNGGAARSYRVLDTTLDGRADSDPHLRLWAATALARIAESLGDYRAAEGHFKDALALGLRNGYLLDAYADFLLDRRRFADARALLVDEERADGHLLRLALAERQLNAPTLSKRVAALRARFEASRMRGDSVHLREEARFTLHLLDDPGRALRLAHANWQEQREPWDARIYLEAALAADRAAEARPVLDWLKRVRLEDVRVRSLAARIEAEGS